MKNKVSVSIILTIAFLLPVLTTLTSSYVRASEIPATPPTIPLPTESPTPTPTVIVPTPTNTPRPTPTPIVINRAPSITTSFFPLAQVKRGYKTTIIGFDSNKNDVLTMTITGLPNGIGKSPAITKIQKNGVQTSVTIAGTPTKAGMYFVTIKLSDGKKTVTKTLPLLVLSAFKSR